MRAAYYEANGAARDVLKLAAIDEPEPGPGEVRVRIAFSGVNPTDVKSRQGSARKIAFPRVIPHQDGAGEIDMVGPGVDRRLGERVWVWDAQWQRPFGTAAEYVVVPAHQAVRLPDDVPLEVGACLGIPAMTAYHAVNLAGLRPADTVLVMGGAGAVGNYAIQFAKMRGAKVVATVSSDEKAALAREAGADEVVDYRTEDLAERLAMSTSGRGADCIVEVDFLANAPRYPGLLAPHGRSIIYGTGFGDAAVPAVWCLTNSITLRFFLIYQVERQTREAAAAEITPLLGRLRHNIHRVLSLDEIVSAHEAVESGEFRGKLLLSLR